MYLTDPTSHRDFMQEQEAYEKKRQRMKSYHNSMEIRNRRAIPLMADIHEVIDGIRFMYQLKKKLPYDCRRMFDKIGRQQLKCYEQRKDWPLLIIQDQYEAANHAYAQVKIYQEKHRGLCSIIKNSLM